ncbi:hypothetical protein Hte_008936 [Hypoxylon texense]
MVSFFIIAALWPIATSFALPCAQQPSVSNVTCHDFSHPAGGSGSVLVNDKLRARDVADVRPGKAVTIASRDGGDPAHFRRTAEDVNECGSTVPYEYNYDHPTRTDCEALRDWARQNRGAWFLEQEDQPPAHQTIILAQSGSCAFSVLMWASTMASGISIGNTDVADIITAMLDDDDNGDDKTGIRGVSRCNTYDGRSQETAKFWITTPYMATHMPDPDGAT